VIDDKRLVEEIRELHAANYYAYGHRRMWLALQRSGEQVAHDRVKRLMRQKGIKGAKRRGKPWRTTIADPAAMRSPDLVAATSAPTKPTRCGWRTFSYVRCYEAMLQLRHRRLQPADRRLAIRGAHAQRTRSW
jgi:putative transposase